MVKVGPDVRVEELIKTQPEVASFLESIGFRDISSEKNPLRKLTLSSLASIKQTDLALFLKQLNKFLEALLVESDVTMLENVSTHEAVLTLKGILPCPVRIPLLEEIKRVQLQYLKSMGKGMDIQLLSASAGLDWLKDEVDLEREDTIPDIVLSAGFDFFFTEKGKRLMEEGFFVDIMPDEVNQDFSTLHLKDPYRAVSVLGVVPAVFMVEKRLLEDKGLPLPKSWKDILEKDYRGMVSIPVGDFDLFNSILLHIYQKFGEDGLEKLKEKAAFNFHPSQSVTAQGDAKPMEKPAITIMPYFFSRMARNLPEVEIIWPEDGAILSPIYALIRKNTRENSRELIDVLNSNLMGEILSHRGLFPSLHPEVKNMLPSGAKFWWVGWEFVFSHNIEELLQKLMSIFV